MLQNFEQTAQEARGFLNGLARQLGHPGETSRTAILLRAAMHALRDRISIQQSFHLMAQLPLYLKLLYVDSWKYREQPIAFDKQEHFTDYVKILQGSYGEYQFDWPEHTGELVSIIYNAIREKIDEGEVRQVINELPDELKLFFEPRADGQVKGSGNIRYDVGTPQEDTLTVADIASGNVRVGTGVNDTNDEATPGANANAGRDEQGTESGATFQTGNAENTSDAVLSQNAMGNTAFGAGVEDADASTSTRRALTGKQGNPNPGATDLSAGNAVIDLANQGATTEGEATDETNAAIPNTINPGNKRAGGDLKEKEGGYLGTGEAADTGIGNA